MSDMLESFRETIAKLDRLAGEIAENARHSPDCTHAHPDGPAAEFCACTIKSLPSRLTKSAAQFAIQTNPLNAPVLASLVGHDGAPIEPSFLTLLVSKYWGTQPRTLTVSFMEATPQDLKNRIVLHMNAWSAYTCISFKLTNGTGNVRISRGPGGYWSYLGTDIKLIPANKPTMNLQNFSMQTPESEYRRVVRHETGHTLGFPHEHMRKELVNLIDPAKAYVWFLQTYGWSKAMVDAQVLTPLSQSTIIGTPADQDSIMCYQLPGSITKNGQPIRGGKDIDKTDAVFAGKIYPKPGPQLQVEEPGGAHEPETDWDPSEDVMELVAA